MPNQIDNNTYYEAKNITIFPASNGVDNGKIFTEFNGRNMTINITDLNYVVSPNPGGYDVSFVNNEVLIQPGKAIINGFEVVTTSTITYRLPTADELYTGTKYTHKYGNGYALLCLHTLFDSMENLSGNIQVGDTWYCEGIQVCYATAEEYEANENEYLLLGGVKQDGTILINDEKFNRINAKYILVRLEPDKESGVPPLQSTDLLTFINNFLHGYWVSKAGDHEYGNLDFKSTPTNYLEPGYNTDNESLLNNTVYALKLGRDGIDDASDDNPQYLEGYVKIKYCNDSRYSGYRRTTYQVPLGTYYIDRDNITDDKVHRTGDIHYNIYQGYIGKTSDEAQNKVPVYDPSRRSDPHTKVRNPSNAFLSRISREGFGNDDYKAAIGGILSPATDPEFCGSFEWDSTDYAPTSKFSSRFRIAFGTEHFYVGCENTFLNTQNDLSDTDGNIKTTYLTNNGVSMSYISLSSINQQIKFKSPQQEANIRLLKDDEIFNYSENWNNILNVKGNTEFEDSVWTKGFIVSGLKQGFTTNEGESNIYDPSQVKVPDFAHDGVGNYRTLQAGDIYGTAVWSAVYNDYSEMFELSFSPKYKNVVGLLVAQDSNNLAKFTIADKYNTNIVGVVAENPGMCTGKVTENSVPVALAGRVKVKYEGKTLKPGDFVGLSKKTPGFVKKCYHFSKYRCGKVLKVLDESTIEILVIL